MKAVSVANSPTKLVSAGNREFLHIYNNGSQTIFLCYDGDSTTLSTTNGMPVPAGGFLALDNDQIRNIQNHDVYAICASGTVDVRIQGAS